MDYLPSIESKNDATMTNKETCTCKKKKNWINMSSSKTQ